MTFDQIKNTKAFGYTVALHILLLLAFIFVKYNTVALPPLPNTNLIELETISVALGVDNNGMGIAPPEMVMGMPAPPATPRTESGSTSGEAAASQNDQLANDNQNDNIATVNHPSAKPIVRRTQAIPTTKPNAAVNTKPDTKPNNTASTNTKPAANVQQAKYTFDGSTGPGGNGATENSKGATNRGDGDGEGLKGKPGGDPNSLNFSGGVSGRTIVARPDSRVDGNIKGTVAVKVYVDREGTIIRYTVQSAANSELLAVVAQKIRRIKFNKSKDAPLTQNGVIYLNFKSGAGR